MKRTPPSVTAFLLLPFPSLPQNSEMPSPQLLHHLFPRSLCRNPTKISSLHHKISAVHSFLQIRPHTHVPPSHPSRQSPPSDPTQINDTRSSSSSTTNPITSSLNDSEITKFAAIAETWWDSDGPFKPLHSMNPTRVSFIRSALCRHFSDGMVAVVRSPLDQFLSFALPLHITGTPQIKKFGVLHPDYFSLDELLQQRKDPYCVRPLEGLKIVDVGCGGGIISEPLARMGATVTGIDAVEKNIKIARLHAGLDPLTSSIEYCCTTAEELVEKQRKFDAVVALEVIEHVANPSEFCKSLAALTASDGATVISTINRSMRAYATAIVAAEYILHWLPKGTHQWSSFLTPEELVLILQRASISVQEIAGFGYNPLTREWSLSDDIRVNFIVFGTKNSQ